MTGLYMIFEDSAEFAEWAFAEQKLRRDLKLKGRIQGRAVPMPTVTEADFSFISRVITSFLTRGGHLPQLDEMRAAFNTEMGYDKSK